MAGRFQELISPSSPWLTATHNARMNWRVKMHGPPQPCRSRNEPDQHAAGTAVSDDGADCKIYAPGSADSRRALYDTRPRLTFINCATLSPASNGMPSHFGGATRRTVARWPGNGEQHRSSSPSGSRSTSVRRTT